VDGFLVQAENLDLGEAMSEPKRHSLFKDADTISALREMLYDRATKSNRKMTLRRAWLLTVHWVKNLFFPFKPGVPKDARPIDFNENNFEINYSYVYKMRFIERLYGVKLPEIKSEVDWKNYQQTKEYRYLIENAITITDKEITNHTVTDWDYLTEGMDCDATFEWMARAMLPELQNDGDTCLIPGNISGRICPGFLIGIKNEGGKIVPYVEQIPEEQS
jgi:hypothetical protein